MKSFIFDIDDTLYDLELPFILAFEKMFKSKPEDLHEIFLDFRKYNNLIYEKALTGEISMEELCVYRIKSALKDHNIIIDDRKSMGFQMIYLSEKKNISLNPYMKKSLDILVSKSIPLGIISNGPHKEQFNKFIFLGLNKYIDTDMVTISDDVGCHKPDKKIYNIMKKKTLNFIKYNKKYFKKNEQIVTFEDIDFYYVGDSFDVDILGATSADINSIWLNHRQNNPSTDIPEKCIELKSFEEFYNFIEKNL